MLTNLEVSLADMYTGRTVEVSHPFVLTLPSPLFFYDKQDIELMKVSNPTQSSV